MKKMLLFLALISAWSANAQKSKKHYCGSDLYANQLDNKYPGFKTQLEEITTHAGYKTRATIVTIPVIVHVVYKNATENLTDNYINAQIDLLNKSLGRLNSDTTNMRSMFQSKVGGSKIRFQLEQIKRVSTTTSSFDASSIWGFDYSDLVKKTSQGGSDAVSTSTKLNIWVCDLTIDGTDGLVGYAYPPVGAPNWPAGSSAPDATLDGVIIDYLAVGGPGKAPKGYSTYGFVGKSTVHEVGHYLGLRHIWGDDGGACQGDFGYKDDGISDTPVTDDNSNFDCDKVKNTCIEASGDLADMVENYMDYSEETCQNSFTKLQVSAMEYVIDNIRTGVRYPLGVNETAALANKISIYPNPVSDILFIDVRDLNFVHAKITMTNTVGQVVSLLEAPKSNEPMQINTNCISKGMYFVNIQLDEEKTITKKIIIR